MANRPNRQRQPFRFWLPSWTNPPPPLRPPTTQGRSQTRTPASPAQPPATAAPQSPNQAQPKPTTSAAPSSPSTPPQSPNQTQQKPTASASPTQPQPITRGTTRTPTPPPSPLVTPSSSRRSPQRPPTQPSPSRAAAQPGSPSAAQPQPASRGTPPSSREPETKIQAALSSQGVPQLSPLPSPSEPEQKTQAPSSPLVTPSSSRRSPQRPPTQPSPSRTAAQPGSPSAAQPQPASRGTPPSSREPETKIQAALPSQGVPQLSPLPSPSEPEQKTQAPLPSPSEPEQNKQAPLPSQGTSPPHPSTLGEDQPPSPPRTSTLEPQEPQAALDTLSPIVSDPENQLQHTPKEQESVPAQPTPQTSTTLNEILQQLESKLLHTDRLPAQAVPSTPNQSPEKIMKDTETKPELKPETVGKLEQTLEDRIEEKFKTKSDLDRDMNFIETSKPGNNPKEIKGEPLKQAGEILEIQPTENPKQKRDSEESQETKELKTRADMIQKIDPKETTKPEPISEIIKKYNSITKVAAQDNKPRMGASEMSGTKVEPKIAILVSDSKPTISQPNNSELTSEIIMLEPEQKLQENIKGKDKTPQNGNNSSSSREGRIAISSIPRRLASDGEQTNFQKEIKEGLSKLVQKLGTGQQPGGDQGVTIITLAGENTGATMVLDFEAVNGEGSVQSNRGYRLADKVGASRDNHVRPEDQFDQTDNANPDITTSINSNVQSINNSLMQESSCSEGDPGVHLIISSKPKGPVYLIRHKGTLQTQKTASSTLQPQKHTYEPLVRRRCLRGLLLESSESDPENPQKPPRHGCRVSCDDKRKGKAEDEGMSASKRNERKHEEMF